MRAVNLTEMRALILAALNANTPINLIGAPGIGKTEIVGAIAQSMGIPLYSLILSQIDPSDIGGIPVPTNGAIVRMPIGPIRDAGQVPGILFLDEASQASPAIQGGALTLINERRAGDFRLHPDTRIVLGMNPPDSAANGNELAPPFQNRIIHVEVCPELSEVQAYLFALGAEGSALRTLASDYAATLESSPRLLQVDPPSGVASSGQRWASPRMIVRGLTMCAQLDSDSQLFGIALSGAIGEESAGAYLAIRKVRDRLPKATDILNDPKNSKVPGPDDVDACVASLGVLAEVAQKDVSAGWVWADRMQNPEIQIAAGKTLLRFPMSPGKACKFVPDATRARAKIMGRSGMVLAGV